MRVSSYLLCRNFEVMPQQLRDISFTNSVPRLFTSPDQTSVLKAKGQIPVHDSTACGDKWSSSLVDFDISVILSLRLREMVCFTLWCTFCGTIVVLQNNVH
jgi:hypothetical protein